MSGLSLVFAGVLGAGWPRPETVVTLRRQVDERPGPRVRALLCLPIGATPLSSGYCQPGAEAGPEVGTVCNRLL
jgi:hypothetical protein